MGEVVPGCIGAEYVGSQTDFCVLESAIMATMEEESDWDDSGTQGRTESAANQTEAETDTPADVEGDKVDTGSWEYGFQIKLYWEEGYTWQNETRERKCKWLLISHVEDALYKQFHSLITCTLSFLFQGA